VGDRDGQSVALAQSGLKTVLPGATGEPVAAAGGPDVDLPQYKLPGGESTPIGGA
jgi:hypothetical protein